MTTMTHVGIPFPFSARRFHADFVVPEGAVPVAARDPDAPAGGCGASAAGSTRRLRWPECAAAAADATITARSAATALDCISGLAERCAVPRGLGRWMRASRDLPSLGREDP